jgi:hypothetical protein
MRLVLWGNHREPEQAQVGVREIGWMTQQIRNDGSDLNISTKTMQQDVVGPMTRRDTLASFVWSKRKGFSSGE